jgi:pimeloyl-ACP methyl ester carboxylesterase
MLHHQTSGSGNTIVLVHGFCENNTCFNKQVLLLNGQHQVITVDLPGFGKSTIGNHPATMSSMADALHLTLKNIGVSKPVIVGHSMGGYVTLAYAKKYITDLAGIILLHSTAVADTEERKAKRLQAIDFIKQNGSETYIRNFIPPLFAEKNKGAEMVAEVLTQGLTCTAEGLTEALLAMKERNDSLDFISSTHLPVGYIAGKEDTIIPLNDLLKQSSLLHNGMITVLNESGHMGMVEEPSKCAQALAAFVSYCNPSIVK